MPLWLLIMSGLLASPNAVEVSPAASPGTVRIQNVGAGAIQLAWAIRVEQRFEGGWRPVAVDHLGLRETCENAPAPACVTLSPGESLTPAPWTGYSCSAQCDETCRANVYHGPGGFRLYVQSFDGEQKFYGPSFELEADPATATQGG